MKIFLDTSIRNFEFWSGAKDTVEELSQQDLDQIEVTLDDIYPEGMTDAQLNDIFWFERDFIAECLGYQNWEEFVNKDVEDEEDEDEEDEE